LSVLRVLTKKTPEINAKVKYTSFTGPILAKVVKYSTLTNLSSSGSFQPSIVNEGAPLEDFCRERAHYLKERDSIMLQGVISRGDIYLGVFFIPGATLLCCCS
jgi:hypothetical protein